ncbi:MAG TPA: hypothetical protein VNQ76_04575, partial [Planctomicrobium sp.]|nr:hypothetical protein [Planctomicrobium sp.]
SSSLATQCLLFFSLKEERVVSQVVFNTNLEAELLGECVPKPELGNEEQRLHSAKVLRISKFYQQQ